MNTLIISQPQMKEKCKYCYILKRTPRPASYPMSTGGKTLGLEADHSSASSNEIKNEWSYTSTPLYVFRTEPEYKDSQWIVWKCGKIQILGDDSDQS